MHRTRRVPRRLAGTIRIFVEVERNTKILSAEKLMNPTEALGLTQGIGSDRGEGKGTLSNKCTLRSFPCLVGITPHYVSPVISVNLPYNAFLLLFVSREVNFVSIWSYRKCAEILTTPVSVL